MAYHEPNVWLPRIDAGEVLTLKYGTETLEVWRQLGLYLRRESNSISATVVDDDSRKTLVDALGDWNRGRDVDVAWKPAPPGRKLDTPPELPPLLGRSSSGTWHSYFIPLDDGRWLECTQLHNEGADYGASFDTYQTRMHTAEPAQNEMVRYRR